MASPSERPSGRGRGALLLTQLRERRERERREREGSGDGEDSTTLGSEDVTTVQSVIEAVEDLKPFDSKSVTEEAEPKKETKLEPVVRRGEKGTKTPVTANFVRLDKMDNRQIYEYSVIFEPTLDDESLRHQAVYNITNVIGKTKTFNGFKLFLPKDLQEDELEHNVELPNGDKVLVKLTRNGLKSLADPECIILLNSIFKRIFRVLKLVPLGKTQAKSYYNIKAKEILEKYRLEIWPGYVVNVDEFESGVMLQVDSSAKVMRTETVLDILIGLTRKFPSSLQDEAKRALIGSTVITRYNNRSYKIDDIDFQKHPESTFTNAKGEDCKYVDYYTNRYHVDIKDLKQPLLVSLAKRPGEDEPLRIDLVPELCLPIGLTESQRSDFKLMKDVAQFTRLQPHKRQKVVETLLNAIQGNEETVKILSDWGLQIPKTNLIAEGRILLPSTLIFGNNYKEPVGPKGEWSRTLNNKGVLKGVDLRQWTLIFPTKETKLAKQFSEALQKQGKMLGFKVDAPRVIPLKDDKIESYLSELRNTPTDVQITVTLFAGAQRADRYAAVKKLTYCDKGLANQVIMFKTLANEKRFLSVVQKIALQINCKIGGELWGVKIPEEQLMIVGIDFFRNKGSESGNVAGIVATLNSTRSKYYSKVIMSKAGIGKFEDELAAVLIDAVQAYLALNETVPKKILVYRDGVQTGSLNSLKTEGNGLFVKLCDFYESRGSPMLGFSYVAVQKNTNTKLYTNPNPKKPDDVVNPVAGTVLDHTITSRNWYDFYIIPMNVNQGTVTPIHYVVCFDTSNLKPDFIQKVTYVMGHIYFNWTGQVKVPAVCLYARKLSEMVGEHLHREPCEKMKNDLFYL